MVRRQQAADRALRPKLRSPGHPKYQRHVEAAFWTEIAKGLLPEEAAAPSPDVPWEFAAGGGHADDAAALDLTTLCEFVLAHTGAASLHEEFDTEHLPRPRGPRGLGCILHLADDPDSARMWWQYAAGADDDIAAFCLYLHHHSLGESDVADQWSRWTSIDTQPTPEPLTRTSPPPPVPTVDISTPTVLRLLACLINRQHRPRSEFATALINYVPRAVAAGYVDNPATEMPVAGEHFAEQISVILAFTTEMNHALGAPLFSCPHRCIPRKLPHRPA